MTATQTTVSYSPTDLDLDLRWWAAANYLTVAPDLPAAQRSAARAPHARAHQAPARSVTGAPAPGLSMIYTLLNRLIRETGTTGSTSPARATAARPGRRRLPRGHVLRGLPAHRRGRGSACVRCSGSSPRPAASRATSASRRPGSIHEGGELGYALVHAAGAAFDHPDLLVACVVGDGEAETGPLAASWRLPASSTRGATARCCRSCTSTATRSPARPCSGGTTTRTSTAFLRSQGWDPVVVAGDDPADGVPAPVCRAAQRPRADPDLQTRARSEGASSPTGRRRWPAIVLRTPKGWTGPRRGRRRRRSRARSAPTRCRCRASRRTPSTCALLEEWLRSYRPEDAVRRGRPPGPRAARPGARRATCGCPPSPYANGGRLTPGPADPRPAARTQVPVEVPGRLGATRHPDRSASCCATSTRRRRPPTAAGRSGCSAPTRRPATGCSAVFEADRPVPAGARPGRDRRPPRSRRAG